MQPFFLTFEKIFFIILPWCYPFLHRYTQMALLSANRNRVIFMYISRYEIRHRSYICQLMEQCSSDCRNVIGSKISRQFFNY